MDLVQLRGTLSCAALLLWLLLRNPGLLMVKRRDIPFFMVLGILGMAAVQFTYLYSISKIHVSLAILLEYLAPSFIAVYTVVVLRERLSRATLLAVLGTTVGCYLAVGAYSMNLLAMNGPGIAVGVCSGVAFAWYAVQSERGMRRYPPWTVLFQSILYAALFWNLVLPPFQAFRHPYSLVEWAGIGYIAVFGTVVPYGLYTTGISLIRSSRAVVTATLEPIVAGIISWFAFGESLEPVQMAGGALVVVSVVLLQLNRETDANTPEILRARADMERTRG